MTENAIPAYSIGEIVLCRPRWPNKPAFGIWTSDTHLVTVGRPARISDYFCGRYSVQFDRDADGTFHDCHWGGISEAEIVRSLNGIGKVDPHGSETE